MGLHLILLADLPWMLQPGNWPIIALGLMGLGFVIFVHELGHFAVAKMCGVKCEKFYIGFDINGWKLWKYQWGETEYGIGALPLGGYVKMLGQEDNPSRVAEEMERAKLRAETGEAAPPGEEAFTLDPRSYMAQSVPKRMAIISAGVIMNVIFAFVFATIAYLLGVETPPCIAGPINPGDAAWKAGLLTGDEVIRVGDLKNPRFQDLQKQVALGDNEHGVPLLIKRPGVQEPISLTVMPETKDGGLAPTIGVSPPTSTQLSDTDPVGDNSPAAAAQPPFAKSDTIVAINDVPVATYAELNAQLARHINDTVKMTVRRVADKSASAAAQTVDISVPPRPVRELGMIMDWGPIVAIQPNSPASEAGVQAGDEIRSIDGKPPGDPVTLPERLRRRGGEMVTIELVRKGQDDPVKVTATLRDPPWFETTTSLGGPMSAPALGIAYNIENTVASVVAGSPAEQGGVKPGDRVVQVVLAQPEKKEVTVKFGDTHNWPALMHTLPTAAPGTKLIITLQDDRKVELLPVDSTEWFYPIRGLAVQMMTTEKQATSIGEAMSLGYTETLDSLTMVVRFIRKLFGRQVSPMAAGGPFAIMEQAARSAEHGPSTLLIFLCMLSANLAVINFLPIPVLDGGHMVFLTLEGIRGKPVPEKYFMAATYAGFLFILTLMVCVISLDISRWF